MGKKGYQIFIEVTGRTETPTMKKIDSEDICEEPVYISIYISTKYTSTFSLLYLFKDSWVFTYRARRVSQG